MKRKLLMALTLILALSIGKSQAQIAAYYTFSEPANTYTSIAATGTPAFAGTSDDGEAAAIPLGFSFNYEATPYTTTTIGVNGCISFVATDITWTNNLNGTGTNNTNMIAGFWDDLNKRGAPDNGEIYYETAGVMPNRTFTVEWKDISWYTSGNNVNFQIVLFEGSNNIQFNYATGSSTQTRSASIGLNLGTTGTDFISVTPGTPATASTTVANNGIVSADFPTGGSYLFTYTAPSCIAPNTLGAANITASMADLSWVDGNTVATGAYELVVQASGAAAPIATTTPTATATMSPYTQGSLGGGLQLEFWVRADCGGGSKSTWAGPFAFATPPGCGSAFTDAGGPTGSYANNTNETITICPAVATDKVSINFTQFSFENIGGTSCYDGITLYNGNSTASPTIPSPGGTVDIWCWDRGDATPAGTGDLQDASVVSTASDGCLTVVITSDGSVQRDGFTATVSCAPAVTSWDAVPQAAGTVTSNALHIYGDGWHHYLNTVASPTQVLLSLQPGNTGTKIANIGAVSVEAGAGSVDLSAAPYVTNANGWHVMNRTWDAVATTQPTSNVPVRFYYTPTDYSDMQTATGSNVTTHTDMYMYKVNNGKDELVANGHTSVTTADYEEFVGGAGWTYTAYGTNHMAEYPVTQFSGGGGGGNFGGFGALPVELINFSVAKNGDVAQVKWTTATEVNNNYFSVQRSANGIDFITLDRVVTKAPNGNSTEKLAYNYADAKPVQGRNYYRLEQVDIDGKASYSDAIDLVWTTGNDVVAIFPNPAQDQLNINVSINAPAVLEINVLDMTGRVVARKSVNATNGLNALELNLSSFVNGIYTVQINKNNKTIFVDKVRKTN